MESFFKSIKPTKITREERKLIMVWSNDKLIFVNPHSGYHYTMKFSKEGKIDYHLTKEGKKKKYKSYGVYNFALLLKRSFSRLERLFLEHDYSFPYEKAHRNKWKFYHVVFPDTPKYKKVRMTDLLKTKIKVKKIKLDDISTYGGAIAFTKNGTFRGFVGKDSKFIGNDFFKKMGKIFEEESKKIKVEIKTKI